MKKSLATSLLPIGQWKSFVRAAKKTARHYGCTAIVLIAMVSVSLLASSCDTESYNLFQRSISETKTLVYTINSTGTTDLTSYISAIDVLSELLGKSSERKYKRIDKISIKSMSINVTKNTGNAADKFRVLGITVKSSSSPFENPIVDTANLSVDTGAIYLANTFLKLGGVEKVNEVLNETLAGSVLTTNYYYPRTISIRLKGTNIPANSRASLTLRLNMEYTMEYAVCEKVPDLFFGSGNDSACDF